MCEVQKTSINLGLDLDAYISAMKGNGVVLGEGVEETLKGLRLRHSGQAMSFEMQIVPRADLTTELALSIDDAAGLGVQHGLHRGPIDCVFAYCATFGGRLGRVVAMVSEPIHLDGGDVHGRAFVISMARDRPHLDLVPSGQALGPATDFAWSQAAKAHPIQRFA